MRESIFWTNSRRRLISRALVNLFQGLVIGFFLSEAFMKATMPWRISFILAIIISLILGIYICPREDLKEE